MLGSFDGAATSRTFEAAVLGCEAPHLLAACPAHNGVPEPNTHKQLSREQGCGPAWRKYSVALPFHTDDAGRSICFISIL